MLRRERSKKALALFSCTHVASCVSYLILSSAGRLEDKRGGEALFIELLVGRGLARKLINGFDGKDHRIEQGALFRAN